MLKLKRRTELVRGICKNTTCNIRSSYTKEETLMLGGQGYSDTKSLCQSKHVIYSGEKYLGVEMLGTSPLGFVTE